jgi:predicted aspartyl protease
MKWPSWRGARLPVRVQDPAAVPTAIAVTTKTGRGQQALNWSSTALPHWTVRAGLAAVLINGRGPFRFILDTGANTSALSPRIVETLGLKSAEGDSVGVHGVTGSEMLPFVRVKTLRAGEIELRDSRMPILAQHVFADADGILGVEGLQHARVDVDFSRDESVSAAPPGGVRRRIRDRAGAVEKNGLLMVNGRVGGARQIIIDTGAERSLGNLPLRDALQHRVSRHDRVETTVFGVTSEVSTGTSFLAPTISIGGTRLKNLPVTFDDLHVFEIWNVADEPALVLGMDLLGTLQRFVIDYQRQELQIKTGVPPKTGVRRCGPTECRSRIPSDDS